MTDAAAPEGFEAVAEFVERRLGFATSHYNDSYLQRRIKARMRRRRVESYPEYLELLEDDDDEHDQLLDALSINVTGFFRNPEVWDGVREALRDLAGRHDSVRTWSAACADGREAYSLAMLAADDPRVGADAVTVRGTDINERAVALARRAVYEDTQTSDIAEQLEYLSEYRSYVERDGDRFRVRESVADRVSFSIHDLIRDEVPARHELVVCRNLFIYIDPEYKRAIVETILEGLRPGGYLVIGKAETLPRAAGDQFEVVDGSKRIYRRL